MADPYFSDPFSPPFSPLPAQASGPPALRIEIVKRSILEMAPEGIYFRARVTGFGSEDRADRAEAYDPSFHELRYHWQVQPLEAAGFAPRPSVRLTNLAAAHNDSNTGYGKEFGHVFTAPGRYLVRCQVHNEERQEIGASLEILIRDPAEICAGPRTILLDPDGTGDPERYPRARIAADWTTAMEALESEDAPGRILVPRGARIRIEGQRLRPRLANFWLGAWGQGAAPVIEAEGDACLDLTPRFGGDTALSGLRFVGPWDSVRERGRFLTALGIRPSDMPRAVTVSDCDFSGWGLTIRAQRTEDGIESGAEGERDLNALFLHDCGIGNWGDYGLFGPENPRGIVSITACSIAQHPEAAMGGETSKSQRSNQHGPIRLARPGYFYMAASELFSRNGWSLAGGIAADQPCLRFNTSMKAGCHAIIERCAMEGGMTTLVYVRATDRTRELHPGNFVLEKSLIVGSARSVGLIATQATGVTLRNNLLIKPDAPFPSNAWRAAISADPAPEDSQQIEPNLPIRVYSNTYINWLSPPNRDEQPLRFARGLDAYPVFAEENNLSVLPAAPEEMAERLELAPVAFETLQDTWQPRYLGLRYFEHGGGALPQMDRRFATRAESVFLPYPAPGSAVIGSATGTVALDDFFSRLRPDPESRGAFEPF